MGQLRFYVQYRRENPVQHEQRLLAEHSEALRPAPLPGAKRRKALIELALGVAAGLVTLVVLGWLW